VAQGRHQNQQATDQAAKRISPFVVCLLDRFKASLTARATLSSACRSAAGAPLAGGPPSAADHRQRPSVARTMARRSYSKLGICDDCLTDCVMGRFSEVRRQRTVALANDMNAAADEIVKLRNDVWRTKLDPAELRAEELRIREKHGLLEDTPLHDVTRRGRPLL
jgi:hypothetical protein